MKMSTILVPLDGSSRATVALPVARAFAELEGATLHIVHVSETTAPSSATLEKLGLTPEQLHGYVLDQATGEPAARIVQLAGEHEDVLIVMCTHTATDKPRGALGRVAEEVLCSAPCPVVLLQPDRGLEPWVLRKILLPHDGTPTTASAVSHAARLAIRADAELVVLHVAEAGTRHRAEPGTLATPRYVDQPQHEWSSWEREFLERLAALGSCPAAVQLRLRLETGEPGAEIARAVQEHDCNLIVLGWHGQLSGERASTLKMVIQEAACPLFTVQIEP